ncbi:hypothetical protein BH10CYA1_BH10CYA1_57760 [soil metagenome]
MGSGTIYDQVIFLHEIRHQPVHLKRKPSSKVFDSGDSPEYAYKIHIQQR